MIRTITTRIITGVTATASACIGLTGAAGASPVNIAVHTMGPNSPAYVSVGGYGGGYYQHWNDDKDHDTDRHQYKTGNYHKDDDKKWQKSDYKHSYQPVRYVVHKEDKHDDKDWNKCPTGQVWGYDWTNRNDWKNYGKMHCMVVTSSASHSGCVGAVASHYVKPATHHTMPAVHHSTPVAHHDNEHDYGNIEHEYTSGNNYHHDYTAWAPKHDDKEVKPTHSYNQPKSEPKDDWSQNHDWKPAENHNYGNNGGNTTETKNTNNVDVKNNNTQVVTTGNVNASHNTWVGNITTGNASADNTTETNVELVNSKPAVANDSNSWSRNRTTTTNTNNVSVSSNNNQTVRSGSVNVYGNTHVGNITTGDAMATNTTHTNVSITN